MSKHGVTSSLAAPPAAGFTGAISSGHLVFVSAQPPRSRDGGIPESAADQAGLALDNVGHQLRATGLPLDAVVVLTVYATSPEAAAAVDAACAERFAAPRPARTVVGVAWLPDGAALQVAAVAVRY